MVSGVKSLKKSDIVILIEAAIKDQVKIQAKMPEAGAIKSVVTQVVIQAAMAVVLAMTEADAGPISDATCMRPFNWNAPNKHGQLLNSEMKVTKILQTKTYELTEEEKVPIIKNWLDREHSQLKTSFHKF